MLAQDLWTQVHKTSQRHKLHYMTGWTCPRLRRSDLVDTASLSHLCSTWDRMDRGRHCVFTSIPRMREPCACI